MNHFKFLFSGFLFFIFSKSGNASYFQQEVNYTIYVSLNDKTHELSAQLSLIYKNNSGVSLNEIYFHLWPAAYSNKNTALAQQIFQSGDDRMQSINEKRLGTIDSLDFRVNNVPVKWQTLPDTIDICKVILNNPLKSGDSIEITTPFHVKIPSAGLSRLGHNRQAYFITQWYPKPAVFDANGWNYFSYLDKGEYYSEFGKFDVYVTLPENYIVAATGIITNGKNETEWLSGKDSITRTLKSFPENDSTPPSSKNLKTIHFTQDNIHDFAWFADKRWHVLKDTMLIKKSNRVITLWSFFNNKEANYWLQSSDFMRESIQYFSEWVGEYPYDHFTSVDVGNAMGNGMEYPMITAIGNYGSLFDLELTIVHEVGHSWFYGILGNNERCHPWMDEGLTNFLETRYVYSKYKNDSSHQEEVTGLRLNSLLTVPTKINHRKHQYRDYVGIARQNLDQSPDLCSENYSISNYHGNVYYKTSISLDYLKSYLGDSMFDLCMKSYFNEWKFRHPQPENLKYVFENTSGKKLDWVFNDLLRSNKKLDYKITRAQSVNRDSVEIKIKNSGLVSGPFSLHEIKNDKIISTNWIEGFSGKTKIILPSSGCDKYRIDAEERLPELYESNNSIRMKGLFRKVEKINISAGVNKENSNRTTLSFFPVVGWNNYNKFMAGMVIHNISPVEKKFEYRIMPLYATGTSSLAGGGDISYHFYPDNSRINKITVRTGISSYAFSKDSYETPNQDFSYSGILHFTKIDSRIIISVPGKNRSENIMTDLTLRNIFIKRDIPYVVDYTETSKDFNYLQAEYSRNNSNPFQNSLQKMNLILGNDFVNLTGESKNFISYGKAKKGFEIRMFAGYVSIPESDTSGVNYKMSLSGKTGERDYLFDEVFLGRTEESGILSRQFVNEYAGFKTPTSYYRLAEQWMFGINASTTLPGLIPLRLFANIGGFDKSDSNGEYGKISWELGVDLPVLKDIFVIYFPFAYSEDIKYAVKRQKLNTADLIRFELHFNMLNPLEQIKTIYNK